ncbi:MAG: acetyl-CoA carboxylase biotin carboxyl carrier protein [Bacteroidota bacterium]|nr:acetyl-CoA carboxylase biotin carboxyl carrier protein [Bacteroidota bacterium]
MDLKDIQELIKFVAKSGATEVDLEIDNVKISIKSPPKKRRGEKDESIIPAIIQQNPEMTTPAVAITSEVASDSGKTEPSAQDSSETKIEDPKSNYMTIKSSMIGTFYRSASPEKPPFINVGDDIKPGDTICIIEAMKLFNEIESDVSGKIIKVLVDDATPIEFDQPLFLIDPS